jgi:ribose/xylose/arabinose/galactoside ABC-type transport system permease subunit
MKLAAIALLASGAAWAQCSMCRTAAAAQSGHAMDVAIVVLLAPAVVMFCGIFVGIFRSTSKTDE